MNLFFYATSVLIILALIFGGEATPTDWKRWLLVVGVLLVFGKLMEFKP